MRNKELTKKFIMVNMGEVGISTDEKPIIGTQALSPCIGFLLHSKEHKKAIVGHISCSQLMENDKVNDLQFQLSTLLEQSELQNEPLDLKIIEGAYQSSYSVYSHELDILDDFGKFEYSLLEVLEETIKKTDCINVSSINLYQGQNSTRDINVVDEYGNFNYKEGATLSKQFAFDASSGTFVTDKVYFGLNYIEVNKINNK